MPVDFNKEFSERLAVIIGDRPKLQVANDLGCSDVTVRVWLKGKIPFAIHMLKRLHDVYGVDLNDLIIGDESGNEQDKHNVL